MVVCLSLIPLHSIVSCGYAFDADPPPRSAADLLDLRAALSAPAAAASLADAALTRKRLPLSAQFLSLLLHSLVYCLDTPSARPAALAAITAVQQRATLELIPQVLIATSALQSVTAPTATS